MNEKDKALIYYHTRSYDLYFNQFIQPDPILSDPYLPQQMKNGSSCASTPRLPGKCWSSPYLQSAIDIPYFHHQRWDGRGYPRGLKGEDFPLAAWIFAVVDVWDALATDRPYRKAWPEQTVIDYIRVNATNPAKDCAA
jgi:hypothetical protein